MRLESSVRRSFARLIVLTAVASFTLAVGVLAVAARVQQKTTPQDEDLTNAGLETTETVCSECHGLEDVTAMRRTPRDWNNMVTAMAARGANATDQQLTAITRYLTRYYGLVSVNSASAEELSAVLGLSAKDAGAVVEYRKANGKFANVDALLKVPGIDTAKIEAQRDALRFD